MSDAVVTFVVIVFLLACAIHVSTLALLVRVRRHTRRWYSEQPRPFLIDTSGAKRDLERLFESIKGSQ